MKLESRKRIAHHRAMAFVVALAACGSPASPPTTSTNEHTPENACRRVVALAMATRPRTPKYTDGHGMDDCLDELRRLQKNHPEAYGCTLDCAFTARTFEEGGRCVERCR